MKNCPTLVILVEDHAMVSHGIQSLLEESGEVKVIAQTESVAETMLRLKTDLPDLIVADVGLPDEDGLALLKRLGDAGLKVPVLFLSMHQDPRLVAQALDQGARGFLPKSAPIHDLVSAIREVKRGGLYVHPRLSGPLYQWQSRRRQEDSPLESLSERESEVLRLAINGLRNKEIAERLSLSVSTVKFHLRGIYGKLGATSRAHAMLLATQAGIR